MAVVGNVKAKVSPTKTEVVKQTPVKTAVPKTGE